MSRRKWTLAVAALVVGSGLNAGPAARAQSSYPDQPVKIVSPFPAGTVSDICLRLLADMLAAKTGMSLIARNQAGAGGITAAATVKSSAPDGYIAALFSNATAVSVSLFNSLPFDPLTDFQPVIGISDFSYILAVASKHKAAVDLFAAMRAKPGALNIGSSAIGSTPHLVAALLKSELRLDAATIPRRGSSERFLALTRGDVDAVVDTYAPLKEALADGRARAVAVTSAERTPTVPDIPTVRETGASNFDVSSWNSVYLPKGVPREIAAKLRANLASALADEQLRERFKTLGAIVRPSPPADLDARMRGEIDKWARAITTAGIEKQ